MSPYLIQGPALISFSGGRTSAFMLHQIIQAHGGTLPDDVVVAFANTGEERPETLRFVHECGVRWNVPIRWIEWRDTPEGFEEVGFNSASREGEPFDALINKKQYLPNWQARFCTEYLKVKALRDFARSIGLGEWGDYAEVIGLRDDEGVRLLRMYAGNEKDGRRCIAPLSKAKVRKADVMAFWLGNNTDPLKLLYPLPQGFDLGLLDHEGNCTYCFLKGRNLRKAIIRDGKASPLRWHRREVNIGATFDKRDSIADLVAEVRQSPDFFFDPSAEHDAECGLICAPPEAA